MPPSRSTVIDALRIVRSGGELGLLLDEFAAKWPTQKKGAKRRSLAPIGQLLGRLVRDGYVARSSAKGPRSRFTVTAAGYKLLGEDSAGRQ